MMRSVGAHRPSPSTRPAQSDGSQFPGRTLEDRVMKRLSSIVLKVAVVAAFVLTLAAPFRW